MGLSSCQDVDSLVNSIAHENTVECEFLGIIGSSSRLYRKFETLKKKATKEELVALTNHVNPVVIAYASYALLDRKLVEPSKLFHKFKADTRQVSTHCGCILSSESLASLIYYRYRNTRIEYPDQERYNGYLVNDSAELQSLDSLILYSENPEQHLILVALENRKYPDSYRGKIEEWAFDKHDFYALKYVFNHHRRENEEQLVSTFEKRLTNPKIEPFENEEILQMIAILESR